MDLPSSPIVIRESRWKAGAQLAGVAFFGGAFFLSRPGFPDNGSFFLVAVIGGLGLWTLAQLIRPSTLVLDERGFQVDQFWRSWRVRWSQVSNFRIVQRSRSITRYVAYDYVPDRLSWNEAPTDLPPYWTMSPEDLRDLMVQCKDRWESSPPPERGPTVSGPLKPPVQNREPTVT